MAIEAVPAISRGLPLGRTQRILPGRLWLEDWPISGPVLLWDKWGDDPAEVPRTVDNDRGILKAFVRLENATPRQVLDFARVHGVLDLCQHGKPHQHDPADCPPSQQEAVADWVRYARAAAAIWRVAIALHRKGTCSAEDWETIFDWLESGDARPTPRGEARHTVLSQAVQRWVYIANLRPQFWWPDPIKPPEVLLSGTGTFGAIARELMAAVSRPPVSGETGQAACSWCGRIYTYFGRKPRYDRGNYCPTCDGNGVGKKLRQARWKDGMRKGSA